MVQSMIKNFCAAGKYFETNDSESILTCYNPTLALLAKKVHAEGCHRTRAIINTEWGQQSTRQISTTKGRENRSILRLSHACKSWKQILQMSTKLHSLGRSSELSIETSGDSISFWNHDSIKWGPQRVVETLSTYSETLSELLAAHNASISPPQHQQINLHSIIKQVRDHRIWYLWCFDSLWIDREWHRWQRYCDSWGEGSGKWC